MKDICWNVKFFNPIDKSLLSEKCFDSISHIKQEYPHISLSTWRNIAIGRSKIYERTINVNKQYKSKIKPMMMDADTNTDLPPTLVI